MTAAQVIDWVVEIAPATAHRDGSVVDAMRWALQEAGFDATAREKALLHARFITTLQQDFGAMYYDRPEWLPGGAYVYRDGRLVKEDS